MLPDLDKPECKTIFFKIADWSPKSLDLGVKKKLNWKDNRRPILNLYVVQKCKKIIT